MVGSPYSRKDPMSQCPLPPLTQLQAALWTSTFLSQVCVLVLKRHLVSYSYTYGDSSGPLSATRILSFL